MSKPYDLFICHSYEDKEFVRKLARRLRSYGVKVWLDEWELQAGDSLQKHIQNGIVRSSYMLVIVSKKSLRRPWVVEELAAGLTVQLRRRRPYVIPALLNVEARTLPPMLADKVAVDFGKDSKLALKAVLRRLGISDRSARISNPTPEQSQRAADALQQSWVKSIFLEQCLCRKKIRSDGEVRFSTDWLHYGERNALIHLVRRGLVRIKLIDTGKYKGKRIDLHGSKGWMYEGTITKLGQRVAVLVQKGGLILTPELVRKVCNSYCTCGSGERAKNCCFKSICGTNQLP